MGKWCFLRNSNWRRTVKSFLLVKNLLGLVEMTFRLVNASVSLPKWQAVKMIFFAPWISKNDRKQYFSCMYCNIFFSIPFLRNRIIQVMFYNTNKWLIKQIVKSQAHSVSYTLSRGNAVVVEYRRDPATDMFQVWIIYEFVFVNTLASFFLNLF